MNLEEFTLKEPLSTYMELANLIFPDHDSEKPLNILILDLGSGDLEEIQCFIDNYSKHNIKAYDLPFTQLYGIPIFGIPNKRYDYVICNSPRNYSSHLWIKTSFVSNITNILLDNGTGFIIAPENYKALFEKTKEILKDDYVYTKIPNIAPVGIMFKKSRP